MKNKISRFVIALVIVCFFLLPQAGGMEGVQAQGPVPPVLRPYLSADGLTLYNGLPPLIVMADPNPAMQGIQVPATPEIQAAMADPAAVNAAFSITYRAAGEIDYPGWNAVCQTFPEAAKTAFNAAAAIWTSTIQSSVPIRISACWSNLGSSSILGYSGGEPLRRDFSGAPKANTWYAGSLADSLNGSDLDPTVYDDYITYNSNFSWYYGTDGLPTSGTYDLVTVAAHEIAHGLNFSGSADGSGVQGFYGISGYPEIYDTFIEDGGGTKLTAYTNPSASLTSLLTSGNLWFNGTNANAANGGSRVRIYAPGSWSSGSSYAHLDYSTFAGSANSLMVYAVASGASQHNAGPVIKGILKDLGWTLTGTPVMNNKIYLPLVIKSAPPPAAFGKTLPANGATGQSTSPTLTWGTSSGATSYEYCLDTNTTHANNSCGATWKSSTVAVTGLSPSTTYYWQVRANNSSGTTYADGLTWWSFTTGSGASILLANGDFESGHTIWTEASLNSYVIIQSYQHYLNVLPHGGNWAAWLGGGNDEIGYIQQQVTVPTGAPYLVYWHWIASQDICGYDFGGVIINNSVVDQYDLCSSTDTGGWVTHSVNLSSYAGQSVSLQIRVETDPSDWSNLFVDDVSFRSSPAAVAGEVSGPPGANPKAILGRSGIVSSGTGSQGKNLTRLFGPK